MAPCGVTSQTLRMTSIAKLDAAPAARRIFTADRLFAYPLIFLAVYIIASIAWIAMSANMVDPREKPLGYDFITFWAGSWLSLHENPASVFNPDKIFTAEQIAVELTAAFDRYCGTVASATN